MNRPQVSANKVPQGVIEQSEERPFDTAVREVEAVIRMAGACSLAAFS